MNIFEIDESIRQALDRMTEEMEETGCVSDEMALELSSLNEAREKKIEGLALYFKEAQAEADAIKEEAKKLAERARTAQNKADYLKGYLSRILFNPEAEKQDKFETSRVRVSFRKSESVDVDDDWQKIDENFVIVKTDHQIDKAGIKEALKAGIEVKGASLKTNYNIQIK